MTSVELACLALCGHRILRKNGGRVKERAVMFAAVEAMTNADPVRLTRCDNPNLAAKTTAGVPIAHCGFSTWPPKPKRIADSSLSAKLSSILLR